MWFLQLAPMGLLDRDASKKCTWGFDTGRGNDSTIISVNGGRMVRKLTTEEKEKICKLDLDRVIRRVQTCTPEKLSRILKTSSHSKLLEIGNIIERVDKILALRYYWCVMYPTNPQILFDEWDRLWRETKISKVIELDMIGLKYDTDYNEYDIKDYSILHHKDKTVQEYFDWRSEQLEKRIKDTIQEYFGWKSERLEKRIKDI